MGRIYITRERTLESVDMTENKINKSVFGELIACDSDAFAALGDVKWPVNINIQSIGSLMPTDDITPKEAVLLQMMLSCATAGGWNIDYEGFVKEHSLERHFEL